jgi:two-component system sensor histidine kinase KdpD
MTDRSARGSLTVFLGSAPGVGKTFSMLEEGRRELASGTDLVVAWVQTYGRPLTNQALEGLERIPPLVVEYRGIRVEEMDLQSTLDRHPRLALVDELAHTNLPGMLHGKRWQDIEALLDAGIDVWTTVNIQHIESLRDVVEQVTGVSVRETVPDAVLQGAQELRLADITPEALRKRMRHGNIYPPERIEVALNSFFREGNLAALRELALLYTVQHRRARTVAEAPTRAVDRVLIVAPADPTALGLIRRGVRMGRRLSAPVEVLGVGEPDLGGDDLAAAARLADDLGAAYRTCSNTGSVAAIVSEIERSAATHIMVSAPAGSRPGSRQQALLGQLLDSLADRHLHVIGRRLGGPPLGTGDARPDPDAILRRESNGKTAGSLRLYIGYAPGVGKTTRMLEEASRRQRRGAEVAVAAVGGRGRAAVQILLAGLRQVPVLPTGAVDVEAVLRSNPSVVCVDDLSVRDLETLEPRYLQVQRLLQVGINVVGTIGIIDLPGFELARTQLEALRDDHHGLTGPVPRHILDQADEIELVDIPPAELRERVRSGWLMPADEVAQTLRAYRDELLDDLREAALRLVAHHTEQRLQRYIATNAIRTLWAVQERIAVALRPERVELAAQLLDAGLTMARREDAELSLVTVTQPRLAGRECRAIEQLARLASKRGVVLVPLPRAGTVAATLVGWAESHQVTTLIMPAPRARRRMPWERPVALEVIRLAKDTDVHILGRTLLPTTLSGAEPAPN